MYILINEGDNDGMFICVIRCIHREIKERLKCVDGLQQTLRGGGSQSDKHM